MITYSAHQITVFGCKENVLNQLQGVHKVSLVIMFKNECVMMSQTSSQAQAFVKRLLILFMLYARKLMDKSSEQDLERPHRIYCNLRRRTLCRNKQHMILIRSSLMPHPTIHPQLKIGIVTVTKAGNSPYFGSI